MKVKCFSWILVSLLAGCATSPAAKHHLYFLSAEANTSAHNDNMTIGIGALEIATYLKRSEIMLQVGPKELRASRYHHWAEPLQEGVRRYLRDQLSTDLATAVDTNRQFRHTWLSQIDISVDKFHGDLDGQVVLDAHYVIHLIADTDNITGENTLKRGRVQISGSQNGSGYAALVEAQESLLETLAQRIAQDIRD